MKLRIAFKVLAIAHRRNTRGTTIARALKRWKRWSLLSMHAAKVRMPPQDWAAAGMTYELVRVYFKGDDAKTAWWFRAKNPSLGEIAPLDLIYAGRAQKLLQFVQHAREADGQW
jgi:hypothetical protein